MVKIKCKALFCSLRDMLQGVDSLERWSYRVLLFLFRKATSTEKPPSANAQPHLHQPHQPSTLSSSPKDIVNDLHQRSLCESALVNVATYCITIMKDSHSVVREGNISGELDRSSRSIARHVYRDEGRPRDAHSFIRDGQVDDNESKIGRLTESCKVVPRQR